MKKLSVLLVFILFVLGEVQSQNSGDISVEGTIQSDHLIGLEVQNLVSQADGTITVDSPCAFSAHLGPSYIVPNATDILIGDMQEQFDLSNNFDGAIFTAPTDGIYEFNCRLSWRTEGNTMIDGARVYTSLFKNGIKYPLSTIRNKVDLTQLGQHQTLTLLIDLQANDEIQLSARYEDDPTLNAWVSGWTTSIFQGRRVK